MIHNNVKNQGVFVKHYAPAATQSKKLFLASRSLTLVSNRQTDRQTGQKQYAPDHLIQGHKNIDVHILNEIHFNKLVQTME